MGLKLEAIICQRSIVARKKRLFEKIHLVCEYMGEQKNDYYSDCGEGFLATEHLYAKSTNFRFDYFTSHYHSTPSNGVLVEPIQNPNDQFDRLFWASNNEKNRFMKVFAYAPGKWESELEDLYKKAKGMDYLKKQEEKERKRKIRLEEENQTKKWYGIK